MRKHDCVASQRKLQHLIEYFSLFQCKIQKPPHILYIINAQFRAKQLPSADVDFRARLRQLRGWGCKEHLAWSASRDAWCRDAGMLHCLINKSRRVRSCLIGTSTPVSSSSSARCRHAKQRDKRTILNADFKCLLCDTSESTANVLKIRSLSLTKRCSDAVAYNTCNCDTTTRDFLRHSDQ